MLKLLFITTNLFGTGGVSRVLSVRLDYLIKKYNYAIHVVTTNNPNSQPFYTFNKNIVFHNISVSFKVANVNIYKDQLQYIIEKVAPDIIVNCDNGLKGSLLPYLVKTRVSLIYERHGSKNIKGKTIFESIKNRLADFILNKNLKKYQAFVVLNEFDKQEWVGKNIYIIPNPLCFSEPKEVSKLENKIAIAVGRHSTEKQFDKLLFIWKEVVKDYADWVLKIYGKPDSNNTLQKLVDKLHLSDSVELHDSVKNIQEEYSKASMLLHTSLSEAFGLVIIEAMAFGLPVIAFNKAHGPKSLITQNSNGYLIRHNDVKAYANKINLLINNHKLRKALGANGIMISQNYSIESIAKEWHKLYKQLI